MKFQRWGLRVGKLHVTWYDLWERKPCFEVVWRRL